MSGSSKDSAARFFALKSGRKVRLPRGGYRGEPQQIKSVRKARLSREEPQQVIDLRNPPEKWCYVEKYVPGCFFAWVQTVGIRTEGMTLGITGKPSRVNATDEGCYQPGYTGCRCYVFFGGTWQKRSHPVVECCARKTFGDGLHAPDCRTVTIAALGSQIEEHG